MQSKAFIKSIKVAEQNSQFSKSLEIFSKNVSIVSVVDLLDN